MPRARRATAKQIAEVVDEVVGSSGPAGFNETTGEKLTVESFTAYIENMKENEPKKYAKKRLELEKKLSELSE